MSVIDLGDWPLGLDELRIVFKYFIRFVLYKCQVLNIKLLNLITKFSYGHSKPTSIDYSHLGKVLIIEFSIACYQVVEFLPCAFT